MEKINYSANQIYFASGSDKLLPKSYPAQQGDYWFSSDDTIILLLNEIIVLAENRTIEWKQYYSAKNKKNNLVI